MEGIEIVDLKPGQKIDTPGFYRCTLEQHHGQPCAGPSVTSSVLRRLREETPAHAWAFHSLNPNRYEDEERTALRLGRAMAYLIEGGVSALKKQFVIVGPDTPRRPTITQRRAFDRDGFWSEAAKEGAEFWAAADARGKGRITQEEYKQLLLMADVLSKDPAAQHMLGGEPEITMAAYDDVNDLWVLARPDNFRFSGMITDYKRVALQGNPMSMRLLDGRITRHRYDVQMGLAAEVFEALTGNFPNAAGLVFQSESPPYSVVLRGITEHDLRLGIRQARWARMRFRECLDSGYWPGPGEHIGNYQRPQWDEERLMEELAESENAGNITAKVPTAKEGATT